MNEIITILTFRVNGSRGNIARYPFRARDAVAIHRVFFQSPSRYIFHARRRVPRHNVPHEI